MTLANGKGERGASGCVIVRYAHGILSNVCSGGFLSAVVSLLVPAAVPDFFRASGTEVDLGLPLLPAISLFLSLLSLLSLEKIKRSYGRENISFE